MVVLFRKVLLTLGLCLTLPALHAATGKASPLLLPYDEAMAELIGRWNIPGAALAIVRRGRLVYARGFGVQKRGGSDPVQTDTRFRIASLSKPLTAMAVLRLMEQGKLGLDELALSHLNGLQGIPRPGPVTDLGSITVRQLLQHTAGWDWKISGDPMFKGQALRFGGGEPSCLNVARYQLTRQLDFKPGQRYAYSNFGYCLLGLIVTRASGVSYPDYVRRELLEPMGVRGMRVGEEGVRLANEVDYHPARGESASGFSLKAMAANGGWISSVVDYARFLASVDGVRSPPEALGFPAMEAMFAKPLHLKGKDLKVWYGLGFSVRKVPGKGFNWWHNGSLPGSVSLAVRAFDGTLWVAFFNHRPKNDDAMLSDVEQRLWKAKEGVRVWPGRDLFADHFP